MSNPESIPNPTPKNDGEDDIFSLVRGAREASFDDLIEKLGKKGFKARFTSYGAPVQVEGFLPGGESFYFRSRWSTARLDIGRIGEEINHAKREESVVWSKSIEVGEEMFDASCLDADETETHLKSLYSDFLIEKEASKT